MQHHHKKVQVFLRALGVAAQPGCWPSTVASTEKGRSAAVLESGPGSHIAIVVPVSIVLSSELLVSAQPSHEILIVWWQLCFVVAQQRISQASLPSTALTLWLTVQRCWARRPKSAFKRLGIQTLERCQ